MTPPAPDDRGRAAIDMLQALYPPPLQVVSGRGSHPDAAAYARYVALPHRGSPRLLVSAGSPRAGAAAVRRQLTGQRPRTRAARAVLGRLTRTGLLGRVGRTRLTVEGPSGADSVESQLSELLGLARPLLAMPVGPARSNRKPVLQVVATDGEVVAFVKVGHRELTRRLVRHEAAALRRLAEISPTTFTAPGVRAVSEWHDLVLLVLTPLTIPSRRITGPAARSRLVAVVQEISTVGGVSEHRWADHPHRTGLQSALDALGSASAGALRALVADLPGDVVVPAGAWHGDLNSGNLALVPGGVPVWDWERFATGVPVGYDLLHHDLHEAITARGVRPVVAATDLLARAEQILAAVGPGPRAASDVIVRSYLLTMGCRYLADDQAAAGSPLGAVEDWIVPALRSTTTAGRTP